MIVIVKMKYFGINISGKNNSNCYGVLCSNVIENIISHIFIQRIEMTRCAIPFNSEFKCDKSGMVLIRIPYYVLYSPMWLHYANGECQ